MERLVRRIAITGPECTGKSELAVRLAQHFKTLWIPEYAREFISKLKRPYTYDDILTIAKKQVTLENEASAKADKILISDTELIVCKIWCEFKFRKCHPWILEKINQQSFDLYLLTDIDLPWQPDPQREHPDKRIELFNLYLTELRERKLPFGIISGMGVQRFKNAITCIHDHLKFENAEKEKTE